MTRSDLQGAPVYARTGAHIRAHFLICFVVLTVLRLAQLDIDRKYSVGRIAQAITNLKGTHIKETGIHSAIETKRPTL